jgi:hypothetical protein
MRTGCSASTGKLTYGCATSCPVTDPELVRFVLIVMISSQRSVSPPSPRLAAGYLEERAVVFVIVARVSLNPFILLGCYTIVDKTSDEGRAT